MLKLFVAFLKVGIFGFGGGNAMLALIEQEVVTAKQIITEQDYTEIVAVNFAVPGVTALKVAFGVGLKADGWIGALVSMIGIALPSVIFAMIAFSILFKYKDAPVIKKTFSGVAYAIVGLLLAVAIKLVPSFQQAGTKVSIIGITVTILTVIAIMKLKWHPIISIVAAGIIGLCLF